MCMVEVAVRLLLIFVHVGYIDISSYLGVPSVFTVIVAICIHQLVEVFEHLDDCAKICFSLS